MLAKLLFFAYSAIKQGEYMAIEQLDDNTLHITPGPFDPHMHLRFTDGITEDAFVEINGGIEGKAGVGPYSGAALHSGIVGGLAMPNEIMRRYAPWTEQQTETIPWPISNLDRVQAMQNAIQEHSLIPIGVFAGIDPVEIYSDTERQCLDPAAAEANFVAVKDDVMGLKLWGDNSTGGYNIPKHDIPRLAHLWHRHNPEKPVILHVEDAGVGEVLTDLAKWGDGKEIPIHIAHVSSRQELAAVIAAKRAGMNVSCEVTVHHLFLDESVREKIGGYGCMKPSLKPQEDIDFLWANMRYIDIFASDCAPHRRSDKESDNPAFGVTNHTVMLPLLLGAVEQGRLTHAELFQKFCVAARERFNLPINDGSAVEIALQPTNAWTAEAKAAPRYGYNPFTRLDIAAPMIGNILRVQAGVSDTTGRVRPSYAHIITPRTSQYAERGAK